MDLRRGAAERRKVHKYLTRFDLRLHTDGVATAAFADRRNVNRRAAVAANHVLPFLTVPGPAANRATVEGHSVIAVCFVDHQEADHSAVDVRAVEVQARI